MEKLDHKQFQSLSQCESYAMAAQVEGALIITRDQSFDGGQEQGFRRGIKEAYDTINDQLANVGWKARFEYTIDGE